MTLVELLVVMALIASLAAMAMIVAPGALEKDRAAAAVTQLQGSLQIARARAMRDGLPRGIRILRTPNGLSTEYQYTEVQPAFVPNVGGPLGTTPYGAGNPPYVQFDYNTDSTGQVTPTPPVVGPPAVPAKAGRFCTINGLNADHTTQVQQLIPTSVGAPTGLLYLPTLGTWHRFLPTTTYTLPNPPPAGGTYTLTVTSTASSPLLDIYPDSKLGAETSWRTYHFGFYGPPQPLLGEPTMTLPRDTCVDLTVLNAGFTNPAGPVTTDYDILFAPSGQLLWTPATQGAGHVFLWVRNGTNPAPTPGILPVPTNTPPTPGVPGSGFEKAGEQMIVVIKAKSGAIGVSPADWGPDPFFLARQAVSGQ